MDKFILDEVESPSTPYDVIVVGGGVSGLRAAGHLQSKYGLKVLLLEAREKLGG
jgi:phytoene dehydrogenase-like protein